MPEWFLAFIKATTIFVSLICLHRGSSVIVPFGMFPGFAVCSCVKDLELEAHHLLFASGSPAGGCMTFGIPLAP